MIFVFAGTSLVNVFNLLYQLYIAHSLSPEDFAALNTLISIFVLITSPLSNIQTVVVKRTAELSAHSKTDEIRGMVSGILRVIFIPAVILFLIFFIGAPVFLEKLKIQSLSAGYWLAVLIFLSLIAPVFLGTLQGMERFGWFMSSALSSGVSKLLLAIVCIGAGWGVSGALGAFVAASIVGTCVAFVPVRSFFTNQRPDSFAQLKKQIYFIIPVGIATFCFNSLVSFDMVLVKYFFSPSESGVYSLSQMLGKIFLFLPMAVTFVMFPRTAGLKAKKIDTRSTLSLSLLFAVILCAGAVVFYNLFPAFVLKILVGKAPVESIALGRLFSVSMSFFMFVNILISYFLSLHDLRFIGFLIVSALVQFLAISLFHQSLFVVQAILCVNSFFLLVGLLILAYVFSSHQPASAKSDKIHEEY
ncbi:MAG: oligosaccharide flippase family protein [Candidatus Omnitrophica bacterium]|nr:oligosaccharide flippase family protein [Candidatus Omnitrophota bacterium]